MEKTEIEREIREFIVNNFLFGRADALTDKSTLLGNVIDSTGVIELLMFLQEKFGITVEDEEVAVPQNFDTLNNVVEFMEKKLLAKA